MNPLWRTGWRYLIRHGWQSALMLLGIALGVAVVVSIDLANSSAGRAFTLSTETLTGKATHQIEGGPKGLSEQVYINLLKSGWNLPAAPVVSALVSSPQLGSRPIELLGIDPFSDRPFRSFLGDGNALPLDALTGFITHPDAVLISSNLANRYGLKNGDSLAVFIDGREKTVRIVGLLLPSDAISARALDGVILADISTAQELTGTIGFLTRIDLIMPDSNAVDRLQAFLPQGTLVREAAARGDAVRQMTDAFRLNLTALSLLALVVGLFLIYNTMTFSVVQRRELFGTLRCLGVTRREVFGMVLVEAALVGVIGSGLGIALGIFLGQFTVRMVAQTINDLYFTTTVTDVGLPLESLLKGGILGLAATLFTAGLPAWEAASVPPRVALLRSNLESGARKGAVWAAVGGAAALGLAMWVFSFPTSNVIVGFGGTLVGTLGAALLASALVVVLIRAFGWVTSRWFGLIGRLAPRGLLNALSRTAVAVTALTVSVGVMIGVGIMIESFRHTVQVWLEETLQSDVYLSAPTYTGTVPSSPIDEAVLRQLEQWPGVSRVDTLRSTLVQSRVGTVSLAATRNPDIGNERLFLRLEGDRSTVWDRMEQGGILLSEPLAYRLGIHLPGEKLDLNTAEGWKSFPVLGIYYDYASSEGTILMALAPYQSAWKDSSITAVGLRLAPGVQADALTRDLQDRLAGGQNLLIRANATLRRDVMIVFDRTFAITVALRLLSTVVAFIGILSALFLLQLEKKRETGILRALGLTGRQLRRLVALETGLMGLTAGLLAMPIGYGLSIILIYVINRRSFGWTLQMSVPAEVLIQGVLVACGAALLAGIYPAWKLGNTPAAEAIRYE